MSYQSTSIIGSTPQYPIESDGLILWLDAGSDLSWPGSGTVWYDITSNNVNGIFITLPNITPPTFLPDKMGGFYFNGTNQKVSFPANPTISGITTVVSVEVWLKPTNLSNVEKTQIFSKDSNSGFRMWIETNGCLSILGGSSISPFYQQYTSTASTVVNQWVHLVGVWSPSGFFTYINGVSGGYDNSKILQQQGNSGILEIGVFTGNSYWFEGVQSVFRVYDRILTSDEVLSNFNSQKDRFGL